MRDQTSAAGKPISTANTGKRVLLSPWVNERLPPFNELLRSQDVARLTRRPRWLIAGLCLIGRFPKGQNFHGRAIGWRRSEVLDWLGRNLEPSAGKAASSLDRDARQANLPFEDRKPCSSVHARRACQTHARCGQSRRTNRTASR
jgi:predicted DNA-binding transcriptional regulator AlpA